MIDFQAFAAAAALLSGGRNEGAMFPIDDAADVNAGAKYIPGEVTEARRAGKRVVYIIEDKQWRMPDGRLVK